MATLLYRIGQFSFRRAWIVILAWALIAGGVFTAALALGGTTQESFAIPGTESQQAIDRLGAVFPQTAGGSAQVVLQVPDGESVTSDANTAIIEDEVAALEDVEGVRAVVSPFSEYAGDVISDDESTVIIGVQFELSGERVTDETLEAVVATGAAAEEAGFQVEFGGQPYQNTEYGITVTELLGVAFAAVVLIITFGSLLAAGMPLLTALVGVGVTMGGVLTVAAFTSISSATPMLALMIGWP